MNDVTAGSASNGDRVAEGPLNGIVVADFSRVLAGPLASMTLGDLGARVIKVERPGVGDETRSWGPPFTEASSTYFESVNRNKESVCLDLASIDDLLTARELVSRADVVLENFKSGSMEKLGLDYESVKADNPGVIYLSISGFGSSAGRNLLGYDFIVQAVGGLMSITGEPEGEASKVGVALVDVLTAKDAVGAITTALYARERTGLGARLEVNLLSSLQGALANQAQAVLGAGVVPRRLGNAHPSIAPYETLACADVPIAVACGNDGQFRRLSAVLGDASLADDPRFGTNALRVAHRAALVPLLEELLRTRTAGEWQQVLTEAGVPAGRISTIGEGIALAEDLGLSPTIEVVDVDGRATARQVRHPVTWSPALTRTNTAPPRLGEHTRSVTDWLFPTDAAEAADSLEAAVLADLSFDPSSAEVRGIVPHTTPAQVEDALARSAEAAPLVAATSASTRAGWLEAIGAAMRERADELVEVAREETGLGLARLQGELQKMADSARFYGSVAVEGGVLDASSESIDGVGSISRWNIPLGPVAVFGASNFPFGFGVFGHDVASALAVGCPVLVKAHPAHPRLSVALGSIVSSALSSVGAPAGAFALVVGFEAGLQLVDSPVVRAVGFTGSQRGGMALVERVAPRGVPVFAEMGTVNPVIVTPSADVDRDRIAAEFVESFTLGAGQFCTKPGLVFVPAGAGFVTAIAAAVAAIEPAPLLTAEIAAAYERGVGELVAAGARLVSGHAHPSTSSSGYAVAPRLLTVDIAEIASRPRFLEECFGPVALVAEYSSVDQVVEGLGRLQPSLAASVITGAAPDAVADRVVPLLLGHVGRVAINTYSTGVLTTWSQQHGGPWPATSRPDVTSVGAAGLKRWLRPVSVQNATSTELPSGLRARDPERIPLRVNGRWSTAGTRRTTHVEGEKNT